MKPFFSVVIPLYNKEKFIGNTLNSVLNQTFQDFEIIVVNDGSTDGSLEIVNTIDDTRLHIISIMNKGVSYARNLGISKAKADYIAFLDADDLWDKEFLLHFKELITKFPKHSVFACTEIISKGKKSKTLTYRVMANDKEEFVTNYFKASKDHSILHCSSVVYYQEAIKNIGLFDTTLKTDEDTDYWIRTGLLYEVVFSKKPLAIHTLDDNDLTKSKRTNYKSMDYWKYMGKSTSPEFHMFMNKNVYSSLLKYKLLGNRQEYLELQTLINENYLSLRRKVILKLPLWLFKILNGFRNTLTFGKSYY